MKRLFLFITLILICIIVNGQAIRVSGIWHISSASKKFHQTIPARDFIIDDNAKVMYQLILELF